MEKVPVGVAPGYDGTQLGTCAAEPAPNFIEPFGPLISSVPLFPAPCALIEACSPLGPRKSIRPCFNWSKSMVTVSPVCLFLIVTVLFPESDPTTSTFGLAAVSSLAIASAGFCFTLCTNIPTPTVNTIAINTNNPKMPTTIHTIGLVFFGGGIICGCGAEAYAGCAGTAAYAGGT